MAKEETLPEVKLSLGGVGLRRRRLQMVRPSELDEEKGDEPRQSRLKEGRCRGSEYVLAEINRRTNVHPRHPFDADVIYRYTIRDCCRLPADGERTRSE